MKTANCQLIISAPITLNQREGIAKVVPADYAD